MPRTTPTNYSRTKGEALLDLDFAIEISVLNQRFYERVSKGIAFLSLLAGSAAFVTIFSPNSVVVTVAGFLVGAFALAEKVYDFRGKAVIHAELIRSFLRLKARAKDLTLEQLDAAFGKASEKSIPVVQGLRMPAYNNNVRRHGFTDYARPLRRWEKFLYALV
ncbi:hypothetical protein [Xanthomonas cassavae]